VDRKTIGLVWIGGIILMVALYWIGPQNFIQTCEAFLSRLWWSLGDLIETLSERAFDAVRAAAIALYAVFVVLSLLARRRGVRGGGAWLLVTILFLLLVGTRWYDPGTKWFAAAVLAGVGAAVMTGRLLRPPPLPRDPRYPWGPPGSAGRPDSTAAP